MDGMVQLPVVFDEAELAVLEVREKLIRESKPAPTLEEQWRLSDYLGITDPEVWNMDRASFGYWLRLQIGGTGEPHAASAEYYPVALDRPRSPVPALPVEVEAHMISESRNVDRTERLVAAAIAAYQREMDPAQVAAAQVLYRFFDKAGALLYIGITGDPDTRWKNHGKLKPWWASVVTITVERYPTRHEVEAAEKAAIRAERPIHNVTHNRRPVGPTPPAVSRLALGGATIVDAAGTDQPCLIHFQGCPHWNKPA